MQGQKHQPEANCDPAEIANACSRAVLERYDPNNEQNRGDRGDIEAKDLHDQGRANVGTEHDCQRWDKADQAVTTTPARKAVNLFRRAMPRMRRRSLPKARRIPDCTMCSPPQQKGDTTYKVEEDDVSHRVSLNGYPNVRSREGL
jgi:hypothetical protein